MTDDDNSLCDAQGQMGTLTQEQDYGYRSKQGWPHFLNDMRIVDDGGAELPRDGKGQGILQIRGHNVVNKYHKVEVPSSFTLFMCCRKAIQPTC